MSCAEFTQLANELRDSFPRSWCKPIVRPIWNWRDEIPDNLDSTRVLAYDAANSPRIIGFNAACRNGFRPLAGNEQ